MLRLGNSYEPIKPLTIDLTIWLLYHMYGEGKGRVLVLIFEADSAGWFGG